MTKVRGSRPRACAHVRGVRLPPILCFIESFDTLVDVWIAKCWRTRPFQKLPQKMESPQKSVVGGKGGGGGGGTGIGRRQCINFGNGHARTQCSFVEGLRDRR